MKPGLVLSLDGLDVRRAPRSMKKPSQLKPGECTCVKRVGGRLSRKICRLPNGIRVSRGYCSPRKR